MEQCVLHFTEYLYNVLVIILFMFNFTALATISITDYPIVSSTMGMILIFGIVLMASCMIYFVISRRKYKNKFKKHSDKQKERESNNNKKIE